MAAAKFRVSDIARRMGKSEKEVIFQLQSLGAEVSDASQVLEPDVIQALITGKKLVSRNRSVIMREDKPQPEKKKEAVRPPRPIVQPPVRAKKEVPKEEPVAAAAPPAVIIPEFMEAAEAEERAAKEAPPQIVERPRAAAAAPVGRGPLRSGWSSSRWSGRTSPRWSGCRHARSGWWSGISSGWTGTSDGRSPAAAAHRRADDHAAQEGERGRRPLSEEENHG